MSETEYTIDRIEEGGSVFLEASDQGTFSVPRMWLPDEVIEGDVIRVKRKEDPGSSGSDLALHVEIDAQARREREARIRNLRDRLPKAPDGDLEL